MTEAITIPEMEAEQLGGSVLEYSPSCASVVLQSFCYDFYYDLEIQEGVKDYKLWPVKLCIT